MLRPYKGIGLREGEGDVDAAGGGAGIFAAAGGDDDELAAVDLVGGGSGVAGEGERGFPEKLAGGFVEGAEFFVEVGGADEEKAAGGDDGAAVIFGAGIFHAGGGEF